MWPKTPENVQLEDFEPRTKPLHVTLLLSLLLCDKPWCFHFLFLCLLKNVICSVKLNN